MGVVLISVLFAIVSISSTLGQMVYPEGNILRPDVLPGQSITIQIGDPSHNPVFAHEASNVILNCSDWLSAHPGGTVRWYQRVRTTIYPDFSPTQPYVLMGSTPLYQAGPPSGPNQTIVNITLTMLSSPAALGNSGNYTCEVCVAVDITNMTCYNSTTNVYVTSDPPTNKATVIPACVTADQFASGGTLLLDCQITNTATDATVTYQYYLNGKLIADSKMLQTVYPKNVFEIDPALTIMYGSMGSDFDPRGTYQCIATTLWGTTKSTAVFSFCSITVNDTVIGDPLFAVPLLLNISNPLDGPALCYEVHGAANSTFNLISDHCTSVNAFYSPAISGGDPVPINIISKIGIVAKDINGSCQRIQVNLDGCTAFVNGIQVNTSYQYGEIGVRKIDDRVRVSVPNCGSPQLVSWIVCEQMLGVNMIRFIVSRGLNLSPTSHGIIGQFWNIPISMVPYSGSLPRGYDSTHPLYIVTVNPVQGPSRSFLGIQNSRTWDFTKKTCYYSGNAQGGSSTGVANQDDSVIEGTYTDYVTSDIFSPQFRYNQFQRCAA